MYYAAFVGVAIGRMMVVNKVVLVESLRWADRVVLKNNESRKLFLTSTSYEICLFTMTWNIFEP